MVVGIIYPPPLVRIGLTDLTKPGVGGQLPLCLCQPPSSGSVLVSKQFVADEPACKFPILRVVHDIVSRNLELAKNVDVNVSLSSVSWQFKNHVNICLKSISIHKICTIISYKCRTRATHYLKFKKNFEEDFSYDFALTYGQYSRAVYN